MSRHLALLSLPALIACSDVKEDPHDHDDHNHGITTAVILDFTDPGGTVLSYRWEDPTGDGAEVEKDAITLTAGTTYDLAVTLLNQLEEPVEDVTEEILHHAEEHQMFFTGDAVIGPASDAAGAFMEHAYVDADADGKPIGIDNTMDVFDVGAGDLMVTLRHLPPQDGSPLKTGDLADQVRSGGFDAIGGDNDVQVTFEVTAN